MPGPSARYVMGLVVIAAAACLSTTGCTGGAQTQRTQGAAAGGASAATQPEERQPLDYPVTRRQEDVVDELHGVRVPDPYRWLEEEDDEEVQAWVTAQDDLARGYLGALPGRERLEARFRELYYIDALTAPWRRGDRYFYGRRARDQEKWVIYWRQGEDGQEKVLLDPNTMSADGSTSLGSWVPNWQGTRVAYALQENNADESTTYLLDIDTNEVSKVDTLEGTKYARPQWTPDGTGFYYTYLPTDPSIPVDERPGHAEIRYHALGTPQSKDRLIYPKTGSPETFLGVDLSKDGRWLLVHVSHGWAANEIFYRRADRPGDDWTRLVDGRQQKVRYEVVPYRDHFYIMTNEGAPRYRVFRAPAAKAADRATWEEIVPQDEVAVLDEVQVIGGKLVLSWMKDAYSRLTVHDLKGKREREVELPGIGVTWGMRGDEDHDEAYFSFQSFTQPPQIFETSIASGATELFAKIDVPVDPSPYLVEQVRYRSKDGTTVPMFVVRRKDMPMDGSTPTLLYGYGGFNVSMRPYFRASIYPWLEAGGAYAVANLRGGGEYGEDWHRAGMLENKQNVFDDFLAAARHLVDQGYTSPEKLAIYGGSNGGLLVGAAITQAPEAFGAAVISVPLLDMVRYHLFGSGRTWIPEYGSADDPAQFRTLHAYSPYHRVEQGTDYPATLFLAADSDDRVDPLHARKMAAALQWADPKSEPIVLRIEKNAGHGGGDMIKKEVAEDTDLYAFLMKELGLTPAAP